MRIVPTEPSNEDEAAEEEAAVEPPPATKSLWPQPYPPSPFPRKQVYRFADPALAGGVPRVDRVLKPVKTTRIKTRT